MLDTNSTVERERPLFLPKEPPPQRSVQKARTTLTVSSTMGDDFVVSRIVDPTVADYSISATDLRAQRSLLTSQERLTAIEPAIKRIVEALRLPRNWDGDDGHAPSERTATEACLFLASLSVETPLPRTFIVGDGEIELVWESPMGRAHVSFFSDGDVVVLAESPESANEIRGVFTFGTLPKPELQEIIDELW